MSILEIRFLSALPLLLIFGTLCTSPAATNVAPDVLRTGTIQSSGIDESSGLVASRRYPGAFWTHNDSDEYIYAITKRGATIGSYLVSGVRFTDFEDIGIDGLGNLYLADIGDNNTARSTLAVYKVREPNPYSSGALSVTRRYSLAFPGRAADCESFFVHQGHGYLVTKDRNLNQRVIVYRFPLSSTASLITLQVVARVVVANEVTAADISRDKTRLALLTEEGAHCFFINGDVFSLPTAQSHFTPFANTFMEGACFAGNGLLVSAETRELYLFNHPSFQSW